MLHIILLGTLDNEREEVLYLHEQLKKIASRFSQVLKITLIEPGRGSVTDEATKVSYSELITRFALANTEILNLSPGETVELLTSCLSDYVNDLLKTSDIHGIIGAGGSFGTGLISAVMRTVSIGLPKLIVSTVGSGNTDPIDIECDITMVYSVGDIAGTNGLLRDVLDNAAGAIFGMASAYEYRKKSEQAPAPCLEPHTRKIRVGIIMIGLTTSCVGRIRAHLEENYPVEVHTLYATSHVSKAGMERMVEEDHLDVILDLNTTEIRDLIAGGTMSSGPSWLERLLKKGIPTIISIGATDMIDFGSIDTAPLQYRDRVLLLHNPTVTLMRTCSYECRQVGEFIAQQVTCFAQERSKVEVWLPRGGVNLLTTPGSPFEDEEAYSILADTVRYELKNTGVRVVSDDREINDSKFAVDIADSLMALVSRDSGRRV